MARKIDTHPIPSGPGSSGRGIFPVRRRELTDQQHDSEAIASLSYNEEEQQMTVTFHKRGTFVYYNFPPDVAADWNTAGSRGTYFNLYVRNSGYEYERIG